MMPAFINAIKAVFTASAICMGSCRGTTEVTIITHRSTSSCVVRSPLASPALRTYAAETIAKRRRTKSAPSVSRVSEDTCCCENSIICTNSPCDEEKPVRSTNATQPPSGAGGTWSGSLSLMFRRSSLALTSSVPEKSTATRSRPWTSSARPSSATMASFIWGVDSPVRVASLQTAPPRTTRQSQGTTWTIFGTFFLGAFGSSSILPSSLPSSSGFSGSFALRVARESEIKSPGRSSSESTSVHFPSRKQNTGADLADMPDSDLRVFCRCITVPASITMMEKRVNPTYCQYASKIQSSDVKTWNMEIGDSSCSLYSAKNVGMRTSTTFLP
mmetsp:Transcript_27783/g.93389  ORF Transcript_27783/g.93389 Transcript_27783/m.93389 type:complete len:330 (+) Transcript_27783:3019-4008(+)